MPDYKNMSAKEALREAKDASGMTAEEIARGLGISASHMRRYLDAGDSYFPSLSTIPALCTVMRNTILLQWLEAQTAPERPFPFPRRKAGPMCSRPWPRRAQPSERCRECFPG